MKTTLTSLMLFSIFCLNTIAQNTSQRELPEGAKARLDIGGGSIIDVKYSPDGTRLAVATTRGLWLYDSAASAPVALMSDGNRFRAFAFAFSPDGRTLAATARGSIGVWDAVTGELRHTARAEFGWVWYAAFSADGRTIATSLKDVVRVWDTETGELTHTLKRGREEGFGNVGSLALSPDGRILASGHNSLGVGHSVRDGIIRLWDAVTGELQYTSSVGIRKPTSLAFSPDGRTLAVGHLDSGFGFGAQGWVSLLDAETLEYKHDLGRHPRGAGLDHGVECVAFSADGSTLAIGRKIDEWYGFVGSTLRLWDVNTGEIIRVLDGHSDDVTSVAFSADGRTLASASRDGALLLWEIIPDVENTPVEEPFQVAADVNGDGVVDMRDLVLVAGRLGIAAENGEDVNGDGIVDILDLVLVAGMLNHAPGAPLVGSHGTEMLRTTKVKEWLDEARRLDFADAAIPRGIEYLENLLEVLTPERTALLPNFPNPFNPETWIPYQLARDSVPRISIYSSKGVLVRQLDLGLQPAGFYTDKHYAAYWDGRNEGGELLASGLYVYVFRAGSYRASRRMAIVR